MKGLKSAIKWIAAIVIICVVAVFLANINGLSVSRTVITVDGSEITEGEYKFYVEMTKMQLLNEQGITDEEAAKEFIANGIVEGKTVADYVKEEATNKIVRNEIAVVKAKEAGLSLTDEEKSAARNTDGMEEMIASYGINEKAYADVMEKSQLASKYYTHLITTEPEKFEPENEEITKEIDNSYSLVQHVLVMNAPADGTEADENYANEAKKKAEEVLAKAIAGEDFSKLVSEYNEDPGMESSPEGYLLTKQGYTIDGQGPMVPEFTKGAFAVESDKVNPELVESSYGWHIMKRCAITEGNSNYQTIFENALSAVQYSKCDAYVDTLKDGVEIVKKDNILNKVKVKF